MATCTAEQYLVNIRLPNGVSFQDVRVTNQPLVGTPVLIACHSTLPWLISFSLDRETPPSISFSRLRRLCVVDRVVHLPASVPCLPGTVRCPDAIVRRHPVDAARYELIFRLRFHRHMSLPRIVPFSTALATRRVGACRHFVFLYSYRHDFRRTHDLCSHAPGGQFRVHAKRSNQAISLGLNPPCFAQAPLF
jgi:hypothetical protein